MHKVAAGDERRGKEFKWSCPSAGCGDRRRGRSRNLYVAVMTVLEHGKPIHQYENSLIGIRSLRYKPDGVYVNGERID